METALSQAGLAVVADETRGQAIKRRRLALGIKSQHVLAKQSGVSRDAVMAAEAGDASETTYGRLEAWLSGIEEETGMDASSSPSERGLVTFRLSGNFGVEVTVQGPVENVAELEAAVERLIRKVGEEGGK